jgi:hypothetical protein
MPLTLAEHSFRGVFDIAILDVNQSQSSILSIKIGYLRIFTK